MKIWTARSYLVSHDCEGTILRSDGVVLQFERMEFHDGVVAIQASEWYSGKVLHFWSNEGDI